MEVVWTKQSVRQMNKYAGYIAQDNVSAAEKWTMKLFGMTDQLKDMPQSGRIVPEYRDSNLRELIDGDYRLIYRIKGEIVYIQTIRHTRQNLKKDY
jgi:toxin ParE1/3/4